MKKIIIAAMLIFTAAAATAIHAAGHRSVTREQLVESYQDVSNKFTDLLEAVVNDADATDKSTIVREVDSFINSFADKFLNGSLIFGVRSNLRNTTSAKKIAHYIGLPVVEKWGDSERIVQAHTDFSASLMALDRNSYLMFGLGSKESLAQAVWRFCSRRGPDNATRLTRLRGKLAAYHAELTQYVMQYRKTECRRTALVQNVSAVMKRVNSDGAICDFLLTSRELMNLLNTDLFKAIDRLPGQVVEYEPAVAEVVDEEAAGSDGSGSVHEEDTEGSDADGLSVDSGDSSVESDDVAAAALPIKAAKEDVGTSVGSGSSESGEESGSEEGEPVVVNTAATVAQAAQEGSVSEVSVSGGDSGSEESEESGSEEEEGELVVVNTAAAEVQAGQDDSESEASGGDSGSEESEELGSEEDEPVVVNTAATEAQAAQEGSGSEVSISGSESGGDSGSEEEEGEVPAALPVTRAAARRNASPAPGTN